MSFENEQREFERMSVNAGTACVLASPVLEDFGPVRIKNLSLAGIGLITPQALSVGLLLAVKIANPAKKLTKTMLARVAHVTSQPGDTFLVGCVLETPLTYEELCGYVM